MIPSERARSLILPTTAPSSTEVPREKESDSEGEINGSRETGTVSIEYPENLDLVVVAR